MQFTEKFDSQLAIIIPYYKSDFIAEALKSIQQQTNQNFNLYIGDDASPNPIKNYLKEIAEDFKQRLTYHRFEINMGSSSLTKQWERCIALGKNEKYIWLFSDDDILPLDAVQRFYDFINQSTKPLTEVFRFNVAIINNKSEIIGIGEPHPPFETSESFARRRINGKCLSTACEYIFSRNIYETKNKFVEFPLAWCSDDATWVKFSEENGIATLNGNPVLWRMSGLNISSDSKKTYVLKIKASILYLKFIEKRVEVTAEEKLDWLIGQLNLLGNFKEARNEFNKQLAASKLFKKGFIRSHLIKRKIKHYISRIKEKI